MDTFLEISKLAAVGIVAGLFSAFLASARDRNRSWWEIRFTAYQAVVDALSDLIYFYDQHLQAGMESRELEDDFRSGLNDLWKESIQHVRKAAASGSFLFSDPVHAALNEFLLQYSSRREESFFEMLDANLHSARKCLGFIVTSSKSDLRVRWAWL